MSLLAATRRSVWGRPLLVFLGGRLSSTLLDMRDPTRIDDVPAALRAAWLEFPDLRLAQLS